MKAGTAQVQITPEAGIDLCGYVERVQPSIGVLDDLFVRSLYLESGNERLLWLHCDLISINREQVERLKKDLNLKFELLDRQVLITASHTHSGPATIDLRYCGCMNRSYLKTLHRRLMAAAHRSINNTQYCTAIFFEETCSLARDRRKFSAFQHVDHRLPVVAFRDKDAKFIAIWANYGMHNVALSPQNRQISADVSGVAAELTRQNLPGEPAVLITCGACANTVPPQASVDPALMHRYARIMSHVIERGANSAYQIEDEVLSSEIEEVNLPIDVLSFQQVNQAYKKASSRFEKHSLWIKAMNEWHQETIHLMDSDLPASVPVSIHTIRIGPVVFSAISAEVFSKMAEELREVCGPLHYVVGCANGNIGYLPFEEIYFEGGYEVDTAFMFYSNFRLARGGHERVLKSAIRMTKAVAAQKNLPGISAKFLKNFEEYS